MGVVTEKFCPICGKDVKDDSFKRFGEFCCSEEHAEEYAKEVRARRGAGTAAAAVPDGRQQAAPEPKQPWWRRGGCCS